MITRYGQPVSKLSRCNSDTAIKSAKTINHFFPRSLTVLKWHPQHEQSEFCSVTSSSHHSVTVVGHLNGRDVFSIVAQCCDMSPPVCPLHCDGMGPRTVNTFWTLGNTRKHTEDGRKNTLGQDVYLWEFLRVYVVFTHDCAFFCVTASCVCWCVIQGADWKLQQPEKDNSADTEAAFNAVTVYVAAACLTFSLTFI